MAKPKNLKKPKKLNKKQAVAMYGLVKGGCKK
jgi:hypothetical protein